MSFSVNYLAVLVAALASFVLGALWYSPALFARQWVAAHSYTPEKIQAMKRGMARTYLLSFVCFLVTAWVLAVFIDRMALLSWLGGAKLGALAWFGFAATIGLTANLYSDKPLLAWIIDAGYQLVYLVGMGIILAVWR
ncbi:MAG TPA: DUF1761 domain-containing protein [Gemmatimonadales bacterium]|jgi:hypothetical protein|nr:DUF1761 domain-containing protein [Gemmatimonadales bacterium]